MNDSRPLFYRDTGPISILARTNLALSVNVGGDSHEVVSMKPDDLN